MKTIHVLRFGQALCGFGGGDPPAHWPGGHAWLHDHQFTDDRVKEIDESAERCPRCVSVLEKEEK